METVWFVAIVAAALCGWQAGKLLVESVALLLYRGRHRLVDVSEGGCEQ